MLHHPCGMAAEELEVDRVVGAERRGDGGEDAVPVGALHGLVLHGGVHRSGTDACGTMPWRNGSEASSTSEPSAV
ncbi:MAG: hypothetical protein ACK55I_10030, partial [bacterium]